MRCKNIVNTKLIHDYLVIMAEINILKVDNVVTIGYVDAINNKGEVSI